jgi:hypothetical protein
MTSRRDRSRPGVVRRARVIRAGRPAGGLLAAMALAGCAVGGSATGQGPSTTPRADLAAEAEVAARNLELGAGDSRGKPGRDSDRRGPGRSGSPAPRDGARAAEVGARPGSGGGQVADTTNRHPSPTGATWSSLLEVADPAADHGRAPGHADLVGLVLEDDGRHLRVTVRLAALVPARLADREVEGVGVDLFRGDPQESDFQLFLDGGGHGWRGFLQTPRGFVRYPGTVAVDGPVLTTTVPWAALGGRRGVEVSAFVDWSDGTGATGSDQVERSPVRLP